MSDLKNTIATAAPVTEPTRTLPVLPALLPSGKCPMEEFFYAGGLPVVIKHLCEAGVMDKNALTVSGETLWAEVEMENVLTGIAPVAPTPFHENAFSRERQHRSGRHHAESTGCVRTFFDGQRRHQYSCLIAGRAFERCQLEC